MTEPTKIRKANPFEKIVAERVSDSKSQIPHFYVTAEANVSKLLKLRSEVNEASSTESRLSINDFIIAAVARGLGDFSDLNSVWTDGEITTFATVDIGVVVSTDKGLYIPVLKDLFEKNIYEISGMMSDMAVRANSGTLSLDDMKGGAMSISNVGMYGSVTMLPIINYGQSAVLGVGAPSDIFRPDEKGTPSLCKEMKLALACDHRIYDGVKATQLLGRITDILTSPEQLITSA